MDLTTIITLLDRYGFSVMAIIALSFAVYKGLCWAGDKLIEPSVLRLFKHLDIVDANIVEHTQHLMMIRADIEDIKKKITA